MSDSISDSLCYIVKTNTLQSNYTPIKINFFKCICSFLTAVAAKGNVYMNMWKGRVQDLKLEK